MRFEEGREDSDDTDASVVCERDPDYLRFLESVRMGAITTGSVSGDDTGNEDEEYFPAPEEIAEVLCFC